MVDNRSLAEKIDALKKEKNAVILSHYYTRPEVQQVADFVGDSLALSQKAADTDADMVLFAGVYFMAETAKILSPEKKVLIPDSDAGCSLADSCRAEDLRRFKEQHPDSMVVAYVNTSAEVKALTDVCCTSSNALKIVSALPADRKIIFAPDRNLGDYIKRITGRDDIMLSSDFVGSTAAIIDFVGSDGGREYIIATESGILFELQERYPDVVFLPVPPEDGACGCNNCEYMKLVTLENIYDTLLNETPEVTLDEDVRAKAEKSIRAMFDMSF